MAIDHYNWYNLFSIWSGWIIKRKCYVTFNNNGMLWSLIKVLTLALLNYTKRKKNDDKFSR